MNSAWVFDNLNISLFDVCKNVNRVFAIRLFVAAKDSAMAYKNNNKRGQDVKEWIGCLSGFVYTETSG